MVRAAARSAVPLPGKYILQTENHFVQLLTAQRDKMVICLCTSFAGVAALLWFNFLLAVAVELPIQRIQHTKSSNVQAHEVRTGALDPR